LQEELGKNKQDLETAFEELQSTNEELETTNEELQSTTEELETTNEELQSSNEELETMNEELQSSNEELQALNEELRISTNQYDRANDFLRAVLASLRSAAIVIDRHLTVLIWNHSAEVWWGLRAEEVQGQPLPTLDFGLPVARLLEPIQAMFRRDCQHYEARLAINNRRGQTLQCRVTCTPVIGGAQAIEGAIIIVDGWDEAQMPDAHA
jgi:two-component system CheB/CheR fusion protein